MGRNSACESCCVDFKSKSKNSLVQSGTYIFILVLGHINAGALCGDELVTPLVYYADTYLALVALLAQAPYEVATVRTECRLPQERCHEFVRVDLHQKHTRYYSHNNTWLVRPTKFGDRPGGHGVSWLPFAW